MFVAFVQRNKHCQFHVIYSKPLGFLSTFAHNFVDNKLTFTAKAIDSSFSQCFCLFASNAV